MRQLGWLRKRIERQLSSESITRVSIQRHCASSLMRAISDTFWHQVWKTNDAANSICKYRSFPMQPLRVSLLAICSWEKCCTKLRCHARQGLGNVESFAMNSSMSTTACCKLGTMYLKDLCVARPAAKISNERKMQPLRCKTPFRTTKRWLHRVCAHSVRFLSFQRRRRR